LFTGSEESHENRSWDSWSPDYLKPGLLDHEVEVGMLFIPLQHLVIDFWWLCFVKMFQS